MGVLTIITTVILSLLTTLVNALTNAAVTVATKICGGDLMKFSGGNLLTIFENLFNNHGMKYGVNIAGYIMVFALVLVILFTIFEVINSMLASLEGEAGVHPIKTLLRGTITVILLFVLFGNPFSFVFGDDGQKIATVSDTKVQVLTDSGGRYTTSTGTADWFNTKGIIGYFGEMGATVLDWVTGGELPDEGAGLKIAVNTDIADMVVLVVLALGVFKGVIQAAITFVERYITFAFYVLVGPLAVATNASKQTERTFHDWMIGLLSQFLTMFITLIAFRMFLSVQGSSSIEGGHALTGGISQELLLDYAIQLALLGLISNSEKIVNALGLRTIATGDAARGYAAGARVAGRAFAMTGGRAIAGMVNGGFQKLTHRNAQFAQSTFGTKLSKPFTAMDTLGKKQLGSPENRPNNSLFNLSGKSAKLNSQTGQMEVAGGLGNVISSNTKNIQSSKTIGGSTLRYNDAVGKTNAINVGKEFSQQDNNYVNGLQTAGGFETKSTAYVGAYHDGSSGNTVGATVFRGKENYDNGKIHESYYGTINSNDVHVGDKIVTGENGESAYHVSRIIAPCANETATFVEYAPNEALNASQYGALPNEEQDHYSDSNQYNHAMVENRNYVESVVNDGNYTSTVESEGIYREFFEKDEDNIQHEYDRNNHVYELGTEQNVETGYRQPKEGEDINQLFDNVDENVNASQEINNELRAQKEEHEAQVAALSQENDE